MTGCLACDLTAGHVPLPGGVIHATGNWRVEHCIGPLGLGTLIVKPVRHVTAVAQLTSTEAAELGPLLVVTSRIAAQLVDEVEQVYNCLWSHADGVAGHIHYVVQPVTARLRDRFGTFGPALQLDMFGADELPAAVDVENVAERARVLFSRGVS